ncbi:MAG: enoyl-CoA hydratase [Acetobacteraceae bacterium]|nr:enoyl-CoA hydratase [Acetobacteraceae bacterium]
MPTTLVLLTYDDRGAQGRVATVTLNNPAKLNTMNRSLMTAFLDVMATMRSEQDLRAVILRGAGDRAFVGGADLRELAALNSAAAEEFITLVHRCCHAVRAFPVPVIARIRGHVLGAGLELAASCDIRVASTDSFFGMPEVRVGLPSVVEAALLPGLIGWGRTRQLLLTGEPIDAVKAERWGLVEELVAPKDLDEAVARIIDPIVAAGPRAIKLQKQLITDWEDLPLRAAIHKGIVCLAGAFTTDEPTRMLAETLDRLATRKRA